MAALEVDAIYKLVTSTDYGGASCDIMDAIPFIMRGGKQIGVFLKWYKWKHGITSSQSAIKKIISASWSITIALVFFGTMQSQSQSTIYMHKI